MKVLEVEAKSVLVRSSLPDAEYVVNPYAGCLFGCAYCYASFMGRFLGEPIDSWGQYLYVKKNAVSIFARDLKRLSRVQPNSSILLSSVTDPYQGAENKYRLTRGILEVLAQHRYNGLVSILTKSPLVTRDLDILRKLPKVEVGLTVTTTDDKVSSWLESQAPLVSRRVVTLKQLHEAGITTYVSVGPLLPHFRYQRHLLDELFAQLVLAGVTTIYVEHMNLRPYIRERLWRWLKNEPANIQQVYESASTTEHRIALDSIVAELLKKHNLRLRMGQVLLHNKGWRAEREAA